MSLNYVVYHKDTTRRLDRQPRTKTKKEYYVGESAAKSALTREVKRGAVVAEDFLIAEMHEFYRNIEKTVIRENLMGGKEFTESVNTPNFMSPSSEAYWSM